MHKISIANKSYLLWFAALSGIGFTKVAALELNPVATMLTLLITMKVGALAYVCWYWKNNSQ